jgi:hypothetical protein
MKNSITPSALLVKIAIAITLLKVMHGTVMQDGSLISDLR